MRNVLMTICLMLCHIAIAQPVPSFTFHESGQNVFFYTSLDMQNVRVAVYPYVEEDNVGILGVYVIGAMGDALSIRLGEEYLYCQKGVLAVNSRNYDNSLMTLYEQPDYGSAPTGTSSKQQTLKIYDCFEGWLLVKGVDDIGTEIIGWLPQEMQCPNPWTTCT